ncbi:tachylectin-related carbohydrate-binding protein [Streptomyces sp. ID05-26A]|nr:tachylectin-related carbohydrate-binding protein [Streptomyces sp. ID05-26A]
MRLMLSRKRSLPAAMAVLAVAGVLSATPALTDTASPAAAAGEFTCNSGAALWEVQGNGGLSRFEHLEPETGIDSWGPVQPIGQGWPAATWAAPDGWMYFVRPEDGSLNRQRWNGVAWEGTSRQINSNMGYWADNPGKLTIDKTGAFYLVDQNGELRRRTFDATTGALDEVVIDGGWGGYDKIFSAGDGVLYAADKGILRRFRYHAGSQRWLQHNVIVNPRSGGLPLAFLWTRTATSPGADIIYGIENTKLVWYRYNESTGLLSQGTQTGTWLGNSKTISAAPDSCRLVTEPNPDRPNLNPPDRLAKAALLKTSNDRLQYAYVDTEGKAVHGEFHDITNPAPAGFSTLPDPAGFTGTPAIGENAGGSLRLWAQGVDADVRGFGRAAGGVSWDSAVNRFGRMATPPQAVRTADNRVAYYALDSNGHVWTKYQTQADGTLYAWRQFTSGPAMSFTRNFTTVAVGNTVHLIALRTAGDYCKITIVPGSVTPWTCGGASATSAPAVVPMPDGTLQLFARRTDGKIYTSRTSASGDINGAWTPAAPGDLPNGVQAVGDPAALTAPDGKIQLVVRGTDGFTYRTGQQASASTAWWPWTEITNYEHETAVDPTVTTVAGTWVIAFRTPSGVPKLLRWQANAAARTASASTAGEFVEVPSKR